MSNPFSVISSQLSIGTPLSNRDSQTTLDIIGNDLSGFTQSLPLVGKGIDLADSTIGTAVDAIQQLLNNPLGLAEQAAQKLKVRKVISYFFDGIDSLVKTGNPLSFGQAIRYHKGHGYVYDARGNPTWSQQTTDLGNSSRFPSFGSMTDFFSTTIGTDFYWGIKVSKADRTDISIPKPVFCDSEKKHMFGNGHYFDGWLPAQTYEFADYVTEETEEISSLAFNFVLPAGYKLGNTITTTLIETDIREVNEWLEAYRNATHPSPRIVLPYKNCVYRLIIYTYQPSGELIRKFPFYVLPDVSQSLSGENTPNPVYPSIKWIIVGKALSSTSM